MDSLTDDDLISFSDELEHTHNYLDLERMRFGNSLNVEYDIEDQAFMLPSLTLQPLVEKIYLQIERPPLHIIVKI
jgi:LytS/YehU family sensor histidine kinase